KPRGRRCWSWPRALPDRRCNRSRFFLDGAGGAPRRVETLLGVHGGAGCGEQRRVDAHAVLERAQLLQPLAALELGDGQFREALQRPAAKGVDPKVMVKRPVAIGRPRPCEIK